MGTAIEEKALCGYSIEKAEKILKAKGSLKKTIETNDGYQDSIISHPIYRYYLFSDKENKFKAHICLTFRSDDKIVTSCKIM